MATSASGRACGTKPQDRSESRREHEFYRYFEPIRYMTEGGPTYCDVRDAKAREQHKPFSCPDKTLTAFCQLGALRFKARRCLLFFFDVNYAYAMAEATQSLSLEDDNAHDVNDQLWLGHAKIPRNIACCEVTVNLPSFSPSSSTMNGERDSVYIVNDLTKNSQTWDRPYVSSFPHGRFYAGVPITSPSGINIGAYCILGDEPRAGVAEKDVMFMRDMSRTVMTHLETVRAQAERERANHMVTGLGAFVKRSSDFRRWERRNPTAPVTRSPSIGAHPQRKGLVSRGSYLSVRKTVPEALTGTEDASTIVHNATRALNPEVSDQRRSRASSLLSQETDANNTNTSKIEAARSAGNGSRRSEIDAVPGADLPRSDTQQKQPQPHSRPQLRTRHSLMDVRSIYQRAAEIMCDSLSVDGVAFAEASVRTFGGLAESVDSAGVTDASTCDESETASIRSRPATPSVYAKGSVCRLLGSAESLRNEPAESIEGQNATKLTDYFLRQLLRRHPNGKIWSFSAGGQAHSEDTSSSNEDAQESEALNDSLSAGVQQRRRRQTEARRDAEILASMFPGARTVALHGIRDASRRRWTAGCILWSYDPLRVLTTDTEMNLVAAFCDIIAGETRRLEVQRSDKAKSDFISSISHELRSPLHGILGSTEVLKDLDLNNMASTLATQIDSCGRTLLDIIDHLLDFATLKGQRLGKGAVSSAKIGRRVSLKEIQAPTDDDIAKIEPSVALDDLTEEAVESTVYSFHCKKGTDYEPRTSVILDIDRSTSNQWHCQLATGGWRRICINLITNALKYTPAGYIRVSLSQKPRSGSKRSFDAVLTVSDSGKGMSKDFLENHLFKDFSQEDVMVDGIGLGMHMVGRIVHAMCAKIDVVSEQKGPEAGTTVTVTVPLEHGQNNQDSDDTLHLIEQYLQPNLAGLGVKLLSEQSTPTPEQTREERLMSIASTLATESLKKSCTSLGLHLHKNNTTDCDLFFAFEPDFEFMMAQEDNARRTMLSSKPCVVICNSNPSVKTIRASRDDRVTRLGAAVEYIAMPCGAKTIARAISSALVRQKELDNTATRRSGEAQPPTNNLTPVRIDAEEIEIPPSINPMKPSQELVIRSSTEPHQTVQSNQTLKFDPISQDSPRQDLPALKSTHDFANNQARLNDPASATLHPSAVPTLLLVDDNKVNLQLLTMYAKKRGYPYLTATDGQMAVNAYQKAHEAPNLTTPTITPTITTTTTTTTTTNGPTSNTPAAPAPSIILMDINMPIMDGYEATQHIRSYEKKHQLPSAFIIALTALGSEAAYQEAFGSGCDMFLTKPVKLKDLTEIIEGL